ncbi:MAG TPA: hypothetical protein VKE41_23760 [Roseiflexaceae bacterium]|nr:hypothetical protein [Roseiflexaceae bacterium]
MNIFRTLWKSLKDLFEDLFVLAIVNILWILINAPLAIVAFFALGNPSALYIVMLLGVLSLGPSNAGLYAVAERVTDGRTSSWRDFIAGVRTYPLLSWKVYALWMIGLIVILVNLQFYSQSGSTIGSFLYVLFIYFAIVWFGFLIYIGPLMLLQTDKRLRTIARNAALMTFGRPLFTLVTLALMAIITVASIYIPLLLLLATASFMAIWSFRATLTLIAEGEARRIAAAEKAGASKATPDKGRGGQVRPRE